jgi:hypothetical protein
MSLKAPLVIMKPEEQELFLKVQGYLFLALEKVIFKEPSPEQKNSGSRILKHLEENEIEEAYELLYSLTKNNYTSDILFLGLAITNYQLNFLDAAGKYASQASKLHGLINDGSQNELIDAFAQSLDLIIKHWNNSKIIVNDRFLNLYPTQDQLGQPNAVNNYIMQGLMPKEPFITKSSRISTIGSCFTGNISTFLRHNGFDVPILNTEYKGNLATSSFSDEVFNTYILRYLFELAFEKELAGSSTYEVINQHNRKSIIPVRNIQETLSSSSVFIITLGLSEVWFNKQTGEVYKTAKAVGDYDENVHDFRVSTFQENFDNIKYVYQTIRKHVRNANIIFTLSPVPLKATFRDMGCIPANTISKAILRVALDELLNKHKEDEHLHYFPSYELILDCLPNAFGKDRRYITSETINFIMTLFANHYVVHEDQKSAKINQP